MGDKNAQSILSLTRQKGILKGQDLCHEYGISPEAASRKATADKSKRNAFEKVSEEEVLARAANNRARDSLQEFEYEPDNHSNSDDAFDFEEYYNAIAMVKLREREKSLDTLLQQSAQVDATSLQNQTQSAEHLLKQLENQYIVADNTFYFKDNLKKIAFIDRGDQLATHSNEDRVAKSMALLAEAKQWSHIKVSGHMDFRREVWLEANLRGIQIKGFKPTERDLKMLDMRLNDKLNNRIEIDKQATNAAAQDIDKGEVFHTEKASMTQEGHTNKHKDATSHKATRSEKVGRTQGDQPNGHEDTAFATSNVSMFPTINFSGVLLAHGEAPYEHDKKNAKNYFVTLDTKDGEKIIWGVDLKRAIEESAAKEGDHITLEYLGKQPVTLKVKTYDEHGKVNGEKELHTHRNQWEVKQSEQQKVVMGVAEAILQDKVKNPATQQAIAAEIQRRMDAMRQQGQEIPEVHCYDKAAPSTKQDREKSAQITSNAERTR